MKLIADSGSTKTNWCLITNNSHKFYFDTEGYNPFYVNSEYIINSINENLPDTILRDEVMEISFYGAGCEIHKTELIKNAMQQVFNNAMITVDTDLLATARALLGNEPGFAAILGTGTNTCLYDGKSITTNIDSLGFLLGDEGSGGVIGKKIITDYIRGEMDEQTNYLFYSTYKITPEKLLENLYSEPLYNRFCASYCKFLSLETINPDYRRHVVLQVFNAFFKNLVSRYKNYNAYTFNCAGSVGFQFKDILIEVAETFGMEVKLITKSVITNLADYHLHKQIK